MVLYIFIKRERKEKEYINPKKEKTEKEPYFYKPTQPSKKKER